MNQSDLEDRVRELEMENLAYRSVLSLLLAEFAVSSEANRSTLEDMLWQAIEDKEVHIPAELGEAMPEVNRITRDLFLTVNNLLYVPVEPRKLPEQHDVD
jgi:hypothetical protein